MHALIINGNKLEQPPMSVHSEGKDKVEGEGAEAGGGAGQGQGQGQGNGQGRGSLNMWGKERGRERGGKKEEEV